MRGEANRRNERQIGFALLFWLISFYLFLAESFFSFLLGLVFFVFSEWDLAWFSRLIFRTKPFGLDRTQQ